MLSNKCSKLKQEALKQEALKQHESVGAATACFQINAAN
jgi:hypothetical protein